MRETPKIESLRIDRDRLWDSIMAMARIGPTEGGGSCRLALSDEDRAGRELFARWCREAGCEIRVDQLGNIFARRAGRDPARAAVAIGSHLDTQPHGGKFDGIFGVLAGLEVVRTLNDHAVETDAPIEVVDWTNEEGSRFAPAMLASGVYAGVFELDFALARADADGRTVESELRRIGYAGEHACGENPFGAFLEAHIEQGPILEREGKVVGVVVGGQGQRWYDVTVRGQDSHSGSTPMVGRHDALVAAARLIESVEQLAAEFAPDAVGTVGELHVRPNSRNTIPGEVWLSIDLRHPDDDSLGEMATRLMRRIEAIQTEREVRIEATEIWHSPPVKFDAKCIGVIQDAADELGYANRKMVSGAGHDACQVARAAPTAMIFVPCAGGISHNEQESAEPEHLEAGANTLLHAALKLADAPPA
ncbi:MAG: Zn-dependent hydrolase [bacterium]